MKTQLVATLLITSAIMPAQIPNRFNPAIQDNYKIQYFAPKEEGYYAGDPIPFYHDGVFHVFWLLDSAHHSVGVGGHQWAHCSSTDLIHWTHYPIALTLSKDPKFESLGTGSLFFKEGIYTMFYTTRNPAVPEKIEYVSMAISKDCINFKKTGKGPYLAPSSEYNPANYRDPHVFYDSKTKTYYLLVTATLSGYKYKQDEGLQVYYTSTDMKKWDFRGEFYTAGDDVGFAIPECPTLFEWNGWYYYSYKVTGGTYYRMSKSITGPWIAPVEDNWGSDYAMVYKVETYKDNRRIAVGMAPSRAGNKDDGGWAYAGNLVFRELFQNPDGTIYAGLVKEMMPDCINVNKTENVQIKADKGFSAGEAMPVPFNSIIRFKVSPKNDYEQVGAMLRFSERGYYNLKISHRQRMVSLGNQSIYGVFDLEKPFTVTIVMKDDIIDVCIEGKRCILNRCPEQKGEAMILYSRNGFIDFNDIMISEIK